MKAIIVIFAVAFLSISCKRQAVEKKSVTEKSETEARDSIGPEDRYIEYTTRKTDTIDSPIAKINGYELVYDCIGCQNTISEGIAVYYKKNGAKKLLLNLTLGDYYVDEVSVFRFKKDNFLYVGTTHTYGHSRGYLYYLNTSKMRVYEVKYQKNKKTSKLGDTLEIHKHFELTKDEHNNLGSGATFRTAKSGKKYYSSSGYSILKISGNKFLLVPKGNGMLEEEG